jgi:hypothetical protein
MIRRTALAFVTGLYLCAWGVTIGLTLAVLNGYR